MADRIMLAENRLYNLRLLLWYNIHSKFFRQFPFAKSKITIKGKEQFLNYTNIDLRFNSLTKLIEDCKEQIVLEMIKKNNHNISDYHSRILDETTLR